MRSVDTNPSVIPLTLGIYTRVYNYVLNPHLKFSNKLINQQNMESVLDLDPEYFYSESANLKMCNIFSCIALGAWMRGR